VFLEDYDIDVARVMVRGVDVWLSNPRRPMEASGTSGMKVSLNGVLNISTLDGWWCEGYTPEGGWAIGAGEDYDDHEYQDQVESHALYNLLENEIIPLYYTRCADNLPRAWICRIKNSIKWIAPHFNTHRMVAEYTRRFYNPAAARQEYLTAEAMAKAREFAAWKANVKKAWPALAVKDVKVEVKNGQGFEPMSSKQARLKVGSEISVSALVKLGNIRPGDISVELYHGPVDSCGNITHGSALKMDHVQPTGQDGEHWFTGLMSCRTTGRWGIVVRVLPQRYDLANKYELGLVLWETVPAKQGE
jgi:starch phosphorylase